MNTATRFSVCLLGLAAFAMALPVTKGWSTRYHVVKNFGADSSVVSLRFDSTWKSDDSLLARCLVKDSSLTKDSIRLDTAVLLTVDSGYQVWTEHSCLFPWEPGGLHNWEDSKEDLGKLTIRCENPRWDPALEGRSIFGGSGVPRGYAEWPGAVQYRSPVLTVWDSGAGSWSLLRDNAFGQEWRRIEPSIGQLQKNWEIRETVPGFVPLIQGDSWKWEIKTIQSKEACRSSIPTGSGLTCLEPGRDTITKVSQSISISVLEQLPDQGYRQRWNLGITGSDSSQSWTSTCEYSSPPFGIVDSLRCTELPDGWIAYAKQILSTRRVDGWESQRESDGFLTRGNVIRSVCISYCYPTTTTITETLTPNVDLDRYDYSYVEGTSSKYGGGGENYRTIVLMEKNGTTIRSTAIQPARRATSPLLKALSPEQFHRALQKMPQVLELQIVGVSGTRQIVQAGQFLSWAAGHRGVHWITYAGAPRALQLLVP